MVLCLPPPTLCLRSARVTPLEYVLRKNASASPLECAVPKSLDLKPPEMNSYKKSGGPPFPFAIFVCQSVFISVHLWLHEGVRSGSGGIFHTQVWRRPWLAVCSTPRTNTAGRQ